MKRTLLPICLLSLFCTHAAFGQGSSGQTGPISVPVTTTFDASRDIGGVSMSVQVGSDQPRLLGLDTASVGLRIFASPTAIFGPNSLVGCPPGKPTTVTYGNPARVTYGGVTCFARITLGAGTGSQVQTPVIPFQLLTSLVACYSQTSDCETPQHKYLTGTYGVLGVGIGYDDIYPNPFRTLDAPYGRRFVLRLSKDGINQSSVIFGPEWNYEAVVFPQGTQRLGALNLRDYDYGQGCITWTPAPDRQLSDETVCATVSFDTGNGAPWFHVLISNMSVVLDTYNGVTTQYIAPGNNFSLSARVGGPFAVKLSSGMQFGDKYRYEDFHEKSVNVGIDAFWGNDVMYDGEQGVITIAPTPLQPEDR